MKSVLVLLVICALAAASVPQNRRLLSGDSDTSSSGVICAPQTPCKWAIYNKFTLMEETDLPNDYCKCSSDTVCSLFKVDDIQLLNEYRCQPPAK